MASEFWPPYDQEDGQAKAPPAKWLILGQMSTCMSECGAQRSG